MQYLFNPAAVRAQARKMLKPNLSTALAVMFVVTLPGLISSVLNVVLSSDLSTALTNCLLDLRKLTDWTISSSDELYQAIMNVLSANREPIMNAFNAKFKLGVALRLLSAVISPALLLGGYAYMLTLGRGGVGAVTDAFSRMGCFLKAIGLNIMISVLLFVWMLPGWLLSMLPLLGLLVPGAASSMVYVSMIPMFSIAGMAVMLVLGIRAALHYALSTMTLADHPEMGVMQCIRASRSMMAVNKRNYVGVVFVILLWNFALNIVVSLLDSIHSVLGTVGSLAGTLAINTYLSAMVAVFYLVLTGVKTAQPAHPAPAEDDDEPRIEE